MSLTGRHLREARVVAAAAHGEAGQAGQAGDGAPARSTVPSTLVLKLNPQTLNLKSLSIMGL